MKRIIECLIVALMFLGSFAFADWDGSSSEPKNTREIDGKIFYEISNPEELAWFAEQVNSGKTTINAVLANDIKFMDDTNKTSSVNWTPIGGFGTGYSRFGGVFDGAEYTIYGLYSYQENAGLFGKTERESVVKNVKMANSVVRGGSDKQVSVLGRSYAGGIVAFNNGTVMNCSNRDSLDWGNNALDLYVGGIVGWNAGTVVDCSNDGAVPFVVGRDEYGSYHNSYSGGIVGWNVGSVTNCINRGAVFDEKIYCGKAMYASSGGIVGWNEGSVTGCLNEGAISSCHRYSGGIVGWNEGSVTKCINRGTISFDDYFRSDISYISYSGGIAGRNDSIITNSWNSGRISMKTAYGAGLIGWLDSSAKIYNSYSIGDSAGFGVVYYAKGEVISSFYDSDVFNSNVVLSGKETDSSNVGMHTADMQADRFAWILNTTNGTDSNSNIWSRDSVGYPIFADSVYKPIYRIIFIDNGDTIERYTNYKGQVEFPELRVPAGKVFTYWISSVRDIIEKRKLKDVVFTEDQTVDVVYRDTASAWFMIYFFDADSNFISSSLVRYGEIPVCRETPTKKSTDEYTYKFVGWHTEVTAAREEFDYYAVFDSTRIIPQAVPVTVAVPAWSITASGRNFQVHTAPVGKPYALFDLQGKVLAKGRVESSEMTISVPRAGSYIVRIGNHSVRMNAK